MQSFYKILGVDERATAEQIRSAYRTLARRYHPDINPDGNSSEVFRKISEAYEVLSNHDKRQNYDTVIGQNKVSEETLKAAHAAYQTASNRNKSSQSSGAKIQEKKTKSSWLEAAAKLVRGRSTNAKTSQQAQQKSVAVFEVIITTEEAILGVSKPLSFKENNNQVVFNVNIPAGVQSGAVLRPVATAASLKSLTPIIVVKVLPHKTFQISDKGLVIEVPVSVGLAQKGGKISVATPFEELLVTVQEGSDSGTEMRIKGHGIRAKDGGRGDLYLKLVVKLKQS